MKNNLFYYASSELSQDAFICWLVSFALPDSKKDDILKDCAKEFICLLNSELDKESLILEKVERQRNNIDILLSISSKNQCYKVIIEDKTFTDQHDDQLVRYLELIQEKYPDCIVKGAYYKTGFQGDLSSVINAKYSILTRDQFLNLMRKYLKDTSNEIFKDYYYFWNQFHEESQAYKNLPINKWDWMQVNGFYDSVHKSDFCNSNKLRSNYHYVPNPSGGFFALWISDPYNSSKNIEGIPYDLYLQMEAVWNYKNEQYDIKICLKQAILDIDKMNAQNKSHRNIRDAVMYYIDWSSRIEKYNFMKPKRLGSGVHMSIGIYKSSYNDSKTLFDSIINAVQDYKKILQEL